MIELTILTDDERKRDLIRRYWQLGPNGSDFEEPMESLEEDFGLSRGAILGVVRSESRAVSTVHRCSCGKRKEFDCRKDLRSTPKQKPFTCAECREEPSEEEPSAAQAGSAARAGIGGSPQDLFSEVAVSEVAGEERPEEVNLQHALRKAAQTLSAASRRLERLSHQISQNP